MLTTVTLFITHTIYNIKLRLLNKRMKYLNTQYVLYAGNVCKIFAKN